MGFLFGNDSLSESTIENMDLTPFVEAIAYDDLSRQDSKTLREFCTSPQAQVLTEKQVLKKGTMMRLSKQDDEKRRIKLCAYQLAKADNNTNWKKMIYHRAEWRKYRDLVMKQYGRKATQLAKVSQKEYIKKMQKAK